ncbi:Prostate androgen-regulated mucin-like protein 1 [Liparis tanakae]|uniref:Prostate androgen-regulated mucin-like protein 1 n=1 Tax=Liparis tanakae TaxID=230148 RepID=A0A4Z2G741_9TELE|nr:Prostate androgen-regulated mucin-like protein 1 [Liparis tanakae]
MRSHRIGEQLTSSIPTSIPSISSIPTSIPTSIPSTSSIPTSIPSTSSIPTSITTTQTTALSSGSIAAIISVFIAAGLLAVVGVYYFRIRDRSYGTLQHSHSFNTLDNFSNPMYDP